MDSRFPRPAAEHEARDRTRTHFPSTHLLSSQVCNSPLIGSLSPEPVYILNVAPARIKYPLGILIRWSASSNGCTNVLGGHPVRWCNRSTSSAWNDFSQRWRVLRHPHAMGTVTSTSHGPPSSAVKRIVNENSCPLGASGDTRRSQSNRFSSIDPAATSGYPEDAL